jgi:hypothetical protein
VAGSLDKTSLWSVNVDDEYHEEINRRTGQRPAGRLSGRQPIALETGDQMRHFVTTPDPTVVNC